MFPKLMSLAGNTIILDIICETGSQRVLSAGLWVWVGFKHRQFARLSPIPTPGWWPYITPAWLWLSSRNTKITRYLIILRMTGLFEAKPVSFLGIVFSETLLNKTAFVFSLQQLTDTSKNHVRSVSDWAIDCQVEGFLLRKLEKTSSQSLRRN